MKILGIETATNLCASAIVDDGNIISELRFDSPHVHSEKLLTIIDECLNQAGCTLVSLDGIAVSIGPGSFTGLRIGLSVAKGLAYANGKPLAAVSTLNSLARYGTTQLPHNGIEYVLPLLDARRDEVYTALYGWNGKILQEVIPSTTMSLDRLGEQLPANKKILMLGNGMEKFQLFLKKADNYDPNSYIVLQKSFNHCSAAMVAIIGNEMIEAHEEADITSLEPLYVKDFYTLVRTQHQKEII